MEKTHNLITFKQLNELFDHPYKFEERQVKKFGDIDEYIYAFKTESDLWYKVCVTLSEENIWVAFFDGDGRAKLRGDVPVKEVLKIFSTVFEIMKIHTRNDNRTITFESSVQEASRTKMYTTLMKRISSSLGRDLVVSSDKRYVMFELVKK